MLDSAKHKMSVSLTPTRQTFSSLIREQDSGSVHTSFFFSSWQISAIFVDEAKQVARMPLIKPFSLLESIYILQPSGRSVGSGFIENVDIRVEAGLILACQTWSLNQRPKLTV